MKIALLSTDKLPAFLGEDHPDEETLFAEDFKLIEALELQGLSAERVSWRRSDVDWSRYDCVLVRSTWDYIDAYDLFLQTIGEIEASGARLLNPREVIQWNSSKRYLGELMSAGVSVVPSLILEDGDWSPAEVQSFLAPGESELIVKPLVGVGAFQLRRFTDVHDLDKVRRSGELDYPVMVQPFLSSIQSEGEWSFVFGGQQFLYSVLKVPTKGDYRVQVMYGARTLPRKPSDDDLAAARAVLEKVPYQTHLARVDMVRMPSGNLALMELELIEPQLYLFDVPEAAKMLAEATRNFLMP